MKDAENVNREKGLERSMEVKESVEDENSHCERTCSHEVESESENEQSDSENERLIRLFVREYEMEC